MIAVTVVKGKDEIVFTSSGHADYNPGNDIVCAAVSALLYTLAGALQNLCADGKHLFQFNPGETELHCRPPDAVASTICDTVMIGLLQVEKEYPDHVKVRIQE